VPLTRRTARIENEIDKRIARLVLRVVAPSRQEQRAVRGDAGCTEKAPSRARRMNRRERETRWGSARDLALKRTAESFIGLTNAPMMTVSAEMPSAAR
jgi:hypothetical protein